MLRAVVVEVSKALSQGRLKDMKGVLKVGLKLAKQRENTAKELPILDTLYSCRLQAYVIVYDNNRVRRNAPSVLGRKVNP